MQCDRIRYANEDDEHPDHFSNDGFGLFKQWDSHYQIYSYFESNQFTNTKNNFDADEHDDLWMRQYCIPTGSDNIWYQKVELDKPGIDLNKLAREADHLYNDYR